MIPIATVASSSSSPRVGGSHGSSLQGYLQVVAGQGDVLQKSFVLVQQDKLCLYTDDPAKTQYLQPYAMYDLARVQLVEQGAFQRPKSFGVVTADRGLLEFTCPTNSIRSSWIKVISEGMGSSKQQGNLPQQTMQPSPTVLVHPLSVKRASFIRLPGQSAMNASTGPRSSQPQPSHPMQQTHTAPGNPTMMRTPVMQSSSAPSSSSSHPQPHQQIPQHHNHNHNQYQQPPQPPLQQQYNAAMFQSAGPQYAPQGPYAYQPQSYDGGYYNQSAGYPPQQSQQSQPLKTQHIAPANHSHPALVKPVTKKPLGPKPATAVTNNFHKTAPGPGSATGPKEMPRWNPGHYGEKAYSTRVLSPQRGRSTANTPAPFSSSQEKAHYQDQYQQQQQMRSKSVPTQRYHHESNMGYSSQEQQQQMPSAAAQDNRNAYQYANQMPMDQMTIGQLREALLSIPSPFRTAIIAPSSSNQNGQQQHMQPESNQRGQSKKQSSKQQQQQPPPQQLKYGAFDFGGDDDSSRDPDEDSSAITMEEDESEQEESYDQQQHQEEEVQDEDEMVMYETESEQQGSPQYYKSINIPEKNRNQSKQYRDSMRHQEQFRPNNQRALHQQVEHGNGKKESIPRKSAIPVQSSRGMAPRNHEGEVPNREMARSKSAPHASKLQQPQIFSSSPSGQQYDNKRKSHIPRQDILEWSKNKAWDKHVSSDYFGGNTKALDKAKDLHRANSPTMKRPKDVAQPLREESPNKTGLKMNDPSLDYYRQRRGSEPAATKQQNTNSPRAVSPTNPKQPPGATSNKSKAVSPSFFDFMKNRPNVSGGEQGAQSTKMTTQPPKPTGPPPQKSNATRLTVNTQLASRSRDFQGGPANTSPRLNNVAGNNRGDMTDVAEWHRFTNWLTSIGMGKYIAALRDHGVTKLSIIELLSNEDMVQIGVSSQDIPWLLKKVSELTQRIRSFSEQALGNEILDVPLAQRQPAPVARFGPAAVRRPSNPIQPVPAALPKDLVEANEVTRAHNSSMDFIKTLQHATITETTDEERELLKTELLELFDSGDFEKFFLLWEHFSTLGLGTDIFGSIGGATQSETQQQQKTALKRPALLQAKQAMEFHLYLHFCIYPMKHHMSQAKIAKAKIALRKYLESLAVIQQSLSALDISDAGAMMLLDDASGNMIGKQAGSHEPMSPISHANNSNVDHHSLSPENERLLQTLSTTLASPGKLSQKSFTSSKEFATFAGLVFVPHPQSNPAFQSLFTNDWTKALRLRLERFVELVLDHQSKMQEQSRVLVEEEGEGVPHEEMKGHQDHKDLPPMNLSETLEKAVVVEPTEEEDEEVIVVPPGQDPNCLSPQSTSSSISQLTDDTPLKSMSSHRARPVINAQQSGPVAVGRAGPKLQNSHLTAANLQNVSAIQTKTWPAARQHPQHTSSAPVAKLPVPAPTSPTPAAKAANLSKSALQQQVDNYNRLLRQNRLKTPPRPAVEVVNQPVVAPAHQLHAAPTNSAAPPQTAPQAPENTMSSMYRSSGNVSLVSTDSKEKLQEKILKYKAMLKEKQQRQQDPVAEETILPQSSSANVSIASRRSVHSSAQPVAIPVERNVVELSSQPVDTVRPAAAVPAVTTFIVPEPDAPEDDEQQYAEPEELVGEVQCEPESETPELVEQVANVVSESPPVEYTSSSPPDSPPDSPQSPPSDLPAISKPATNKLQYAGPNPGVYRREVDLDDYGLTPVRQEDHSSQPFASQLAKIESEDPNSPPEEDDDLPRPEMIDMDAVDDILQDILQAGGGVHGVSEAIPEGVEEESEGEEEEGEGEGDIHEVVFSPTTGKKKKKKKKKGNKKK